MTNEIPVAPETTPSEWIARAKAARGSGDFLGAYDLATRGLAEYPADTQLRYVATHALVASGAVNQAADLYKKYELQTSTETDVQTLGARIAKDTAFRMGRGRRAALLVAAEAYGAVYEARPDHYPAVNAATLFLLAGERARARHYAKMALELIDKAGGAAPGDDYWSLASRAEAALILCDRDMARRALGQAAKVLGGNWDQAASTRRQLRIVCKATGASPEMLDPLRPPTVFHYFGPALAAAGVKRDFRDGPEQAAAALIWRQVEATKIGHAYGCLGAGAEILFAEACLRSGSQLHVVLPFNRDEFVDTMVRPAGERWVERFNACAERAKSIALATADAYQGDNTLFSYACRLAMGMAVQRAKSLDADAIHVALQCGARYPDQARYVENLAKWRAKELPVVSVRLSEAQSPSGPRAGVHPKRAHRPPPRYSRALLFGDVKGFSKTPDHLIPVFQKRLMGTIANVLKSYGEHVLYRNSWGDAIYVVIDDPIVAAECCIAMQDAIRRARTQRYGLSTDLALRLSAHYGPVYEGHDPIRDELTFFGANTTLAARIEPVTPPGNVYVTEAMAAAIAFARAPRVRAEYVGNVPMAKGFGSTRMYLLERADGR